LSVWRLLRQDAARQVGRCCQIPGPGLVLVAFLKAQQGGRRGLAAYAAELAGRPRPLLRRRLVVVVLARSFVARDWGQGRAGGRGLVVRAPPGRPEQKTELLFV
jgi:hypothetical protein